MADGYDELIGMMTISYDSESWGVLVTDGHTDRLTFAIIELLLWLKNKRRELIKRYTFRIDRKCLNYNTVNQNKPNK